MEMMALRVERFATHPGREPRRGDERVETHGQLEPVLRREESLEVERTQLLESRLLHRLDETREVERQPLAPRALEDVREQDVLAARHFLRIEARQAEKAGHHRRHPVAQRAGIGQKLRGRRGERTQYRERQPGFGARRVDGDVGRGAEPGDALRGLAPFGEAVLPGFGGFRGQLGDGQSLARGIARIHPRLEIAGSERGKGEQEVAEVALRVDADGGNAVDRGFLEQRQAQTGLARSGHAHAHRMRGQVAGIVKDQVLTQRVGSGIELPSEIERA
jgi:hypothetical protein